MKQIFNDAAQHAVMTAFYALSLPEYHMEQHAHQSCEIMYVTSGSCAVFCGEQQISLKQHQFIFLRAFVPHRLEIIPGAPCSILNLEFCCQDEKTAVPLRELFEKCPEFASFWQQPDQFLTGADDRNLGYAMKDLIARLSEHPNQQDFLLCILFYRTMIELAGCVCRKRQTPGMEYLKKACSYIDQNLLGELSIPAVAAHAGINKSYLQSLFSQMMHCTVNTYINQKRLSQAVFLLTNSSLSVTDVAFASGYNSRQHFAHTFEKFYGVTPSRYRQLHSRALDADTRESQFRIREDGSFAHAPMLRPLTSETAD